MRLVIGLGNPGKEYEKTRHNVGFMVIDSLAKEFNVNIDSKMGGSIFAQIFIGNEKVILMKPQRYINLSGEVIKEFIQYFKIDIDNILIISDDLDMRIGSYKLRARGNSGGHNGLKNIELHLGTNEYKRLKIGISNDKKIDTKEYVLSNFSEDERSTMDVIIKRAKDIVVDYTKMDFLSLMNKYNGL